MVGDSSNWREMFPVRILILVMGIMPLASGLYAISLLLRYLRFGGSYLRFDRFPYFLGDKLIAHLQNGGGFARFAELEVTLYCVDEVIEKSGRGTKFSMNEIFTATNRFVLHQEYWDSTREIPVRFDLPTEGKPTTLSEGNPCFWEIEVKAESKWPFYGTTFLVPVYARPE